MSKVLMYSVFDKASNSYGPPFDAVNEAVGERAFMQLMAKVPEQFQGDYQLIQIGTFDPATGDLKSQGETFDINDLRLTKEVK